MKGALTHKAIVRPVLYREKLVGLWKSNPKMTYAEAERLTGAPRSVVLKVRRDLVAAGVLALGRKADYL